MNERVYVLSRDDGPSTYVDKMYGRKCEWSKCLRPAASGLKRYVLAGLQVFKSSRAPVCGKRQEAKQNTDWARRRRLALVTCRADVRRANDARRTFGNLLGTYVTTSSVVRTRTDPAWMGPGIGIRMGREGLELGWSSGWSGARKGFFPGTVQNLPNWVIVLQWPREGGF